MKTMAELVEMLDDAASGFSDYGLRQTTVEVAEELRKLTAAGFGPVKAARELAWDEGMEAMYATTSSEWPPIPEMNPYRTATVEAPDGP